VDVEADVKRRGCERKMAKAHGTLLICRSINAAARFRLHAEKRIA
jgi:hypothetical protein